LSSEGNVYKLTEFRTLTAIMVEQNNHLIFFIYFEQHLLQTTALS